MFVIPMVKDSYTTHLLVQSQFTVWLFIVNASDCRFFSYPLNELSISFEQIISHTSSLFVRMFRIYSFSVAKVYYSCLIYLLPILSYLKIFLASHNQHHRADCHTTIMDASSYFSEERQAHQLQKKNSILIVERVPTVFSQCKNKSSANMILIVNCMVYEASR